MEVFSSWSAFWNLNGSFLLTQYPLGSPRKKAPLCFLHGPHPSMSTRHCQQEDYAFSLYCILFNTYKNPSTNLSKIRFNNFSNTKKSNVYKTILKYLFSVNNDYLCILFATSHLYQSVWAPQIFQLASKELFYILRSYLFYILILLLSITHL